MTTGQIIKQRRKELKVPVEEIAKVLDVSIATVYRYENGDIEKVPGSALEPLARILQTTPAVLMGWGNDNSFIESKSCDQTTIMVTQHESKVIAAYREKPLVQPHVDKLLDIQPEDNVLTFIGPNSEEITFDDFAYAMYDEKKELTEEDKKNLLEMAKMLKERKDKEK